MIYALGMTAPAGAVITAPVTVDGPSPAITDFGGVSMAGDGTGGLVYVKSVDGVPHIFASRFRRGAWSAPMRVDWDRPYEGTEPRIAADRQGRLLVVWVSPVATVRGTIRYGLFSARIGAGATAFSASLPIDPNVGEGLGIDPSIAATSAGKAIVAYRAITYDFVGTPPAGTAPVQLRPGDVMAEIRLARLKGDRWSLMGSVNLNPQASMRPPTATNGPKVGIGSTGSAVVAWQEPDQAGAARVLMRRVFGTTPGQVLEASPKTWEGVPVTGDVDAFSLAVTPYSMARVAYRVAPGSGALGGQLLVNTLPPDFSLTAGRLEGSKPSGGVVAPGPPDIALAEDENRRAGARLGFVASSRLRQVDGGGEGPLGTMATPAGPPARPGSAPVVAVDPAGGGLSAYPADLGGGREAVAVRQEFRAGAIQIGLVSGLYGGPVAQLSIGRSGGGDGLVGFRQGEPGRYQIVANWATVPPVKFTLRPPKGWIKPRRAKLRWTHAESAVRGVRYSVVVDGRIVKRNLRRRGYRPGPGQLGNGVLRVRAIATDRLGGQVLTRAVKLRVDGQPPQIRVRHAGGRVVVGVRDRHSGLRRKATRVFFGDGSSARSGGRFVHAYERRGRYRLRVLARDRAGNRILRRFDVRVR